MGKMRGKDRENESKNRRMIFRWWAREDSNLQPDRYERSALTIELRALQAPSINAHGRRATPSSPSRPTIALGCNPVSREHHRMHVFSLEREQEWDLKHHVEKILAKIAEGDVTVACWEPRQISPYHCHPQATEIYFCFSGGRTMRTP